MKPKKIARRLSLGYLLISAQNIGGITILAMAASLPALSLAIDRAVLKSFAGVNPIFLAVSGSLAPPSFFLPGTFPFRGTFPFPVPPRPFWFRLGRVVDRRKKKAKNFIL